MRCGVSGQALMVLPLMHLPIRMLSIRSMVENHYFTVADTTLSLPTYIVCCAIVPHVLTIRFWWTVWDNVSVRKDMDGFPVIMPARRSGMCWVMLPMLTEKWFHRFGWHAANSRRCIIRPKMAGMRIMWKLSAVTLSIWERQDSSLSMTN